MEQSSSDHSAANYIVNAAFSVMKQCVGIACSIPEKVWPSCLVPELLRELNPDCSRSEQAKSL